MRSTFASHQNVDAQHLRARAAAQPLQRLPDVFAVQRRVGAAAAGPDSREHAERGRGAPHGRRAARAGGARARAGRVADEPARAVLPFADPGQPAADAAVQGQAAGLPARAVPAQGVQPLRGAEGRGRAHVDQGRAGLAAGVCGAAQGGVFGGLGVGI